MSKTTGRPSLRDFKRHADKFGTASVLDTAIDVGYPRTQLCDLLRALDKVDKRIYGSRQLCRSLGIVGLLPRHQLDVAERVEKAIALNTRLVAARAAVNV
jgi:hypothetical protein